MSSGRRCTRRGVLAFQRHSAFDFAVQRDHLRYHRANPNRSSSRRGGRGKRLRRPRRRSGFATASGTGKPAPSPMRKSGSAGSCRSKPMTLGRARDRLTSRSIGSPRSSRPSRRGRRFSRMTWRPRVRRRRPTATWVRGARRLGLETSVAASGVRPAARAEPDAAGPAARSRAARLRGAPSRAGAPAPSGWTDRVRVRTLRRLGARGVRGRRWLRPREESPSSSRQGAG